MATACNGPQHQSSKTLLVRVPALVTYVTISVLLVPQVLFANVDKVTVLGAPLEVASVPDTSASLVLTAPQTIDSSPHDIHANGHQIDQLEANASKANYFEYSVSIESVHLPQDHVTPLHNWSSHDRILFFTVPFEVSIVIRSFVFIYCCLVIGYLCDEYFVPSLESIGESLNFSNDLIGAILIPFGTSGPEIFSSAVGVFFAENDIGTGAIIGSAVFNMLAIPAACGLAAAYFIGHSIQLQEAPILRDLLFYIVSIVVLVLVVKDNTVDLLDASLLILLFVIYIVVMLYNSKLNSQSSSKLEHLQQQQTADKFQNNNVTTYQNHQHHIVTINNHTNSHRDKAKELAQQAVQASKYKMKEYLNKCNEIMTGEKESIREKVAKLYVQEKAPLNVSEQYSNKFKVGIEAKLYAFIEDVILKESDEKDRGNKCKSQYEKLTEEEDNGFGFTNNFVLRWLLMPFSIIFYLTMPTACSTIVFFFSIGWLSLLSYATVWAISGLSDILGIPPTVSGMTILAAGSAVPDLVTSIIVIKKTRAASMGICAAIASNIFAILLGLGLPWFIRIAMNWWQRGEYASSFLVLESTALPYTSVILLATVFVLFFTFRACKWRISTRFSLICVIIHIAFIASNISLELIIGNS